MSHQITKLKSKLHALDLESLGQAHQFHLRKSGKFSSLDFVLGFFLSFLTGENSLRAWAEKISQCSGQLLSKQGLSSRLDLRLVRFSKGLLSRALEKQLFDQGQPLYSGALFTHFPSVLIEDSTCLKLPDVLAEFFPGAYSKRLKRSTATARIQLRYSLKAEQYTHLAIQSFRQNDQSYAYQIVSSIQAGDLVLRDLGYFVLGSFKAILKAQGHILSRYRFGINLFHSGDKTKICLNHQLTKVEKAGRKIWEQWVLVGKKEQVPLRLIAIRLPDSVVAQRIRKAKKNRNKKANHNSDYYELLKWNIFLTSVGKTIWNAKQAAHAYTLRWRIEMMFKTWKSHLNLAKMFEHKQSLSYERVMIQLYLIISWMVLFLMPWYRFFSRKALKNNTLRLSIAKFTQWVKGRFNDLVLAKRLEEFWKIVQHYCLEEPRQNRMSQAQILCEE